MINEFSNFVVFRILLKVFVFVGLRIGFILVNSELFVFICKVIVFYFVLMVVVSIVVDVLSSDNIVLMCC